MILLTAITVQALLWNFLAGWAGTLVAWILLASTFVPTVHISFQWWVRSKAFTAPPLCRSVLGDPRWEDVEFIGWGQTPLRGSFLESDSGAGRLLLYLHGLGSCVGNAEGRMLHLSGLGFNILTMDLRGHGSTGIREEWTFLKLLADIEYLLESVEQRANGLDITEVYLYGHSMGGYLSLRLAARGRGWWRDKLRCVMLESPMTSFPLGIESQLSLFGRLLVPLIRLALRREYLRIHPDLSVRYAGSELPDWGIPDVPVLAMQGGRSDDDWRMGLKHWNLLLQNPPLDFESHLIHSLGHGSLNDSSDREDVVEIYLQERFGGGVVRSA